MGFKQMKFTGQDEKAQAKFYEQQFKAALKVGKTEKEAHDFAAFMIDYYGHQFRQYS